MTELLLACARVEVTPPAGSAFAGYLARDQAVSQGCHDPLEATLLWLRDLTTGQDVIWVSLDVLGIDVELSHAVAASVAQAVGCAEAAVLVCASHTHSSAAGWYRSQGNDHDGADADGGGGEGAELRGRLVKQIAGAAGLLPPRLRPVRLLFAQGRVNGVGANRHRIDGPHDDTVGLLAAVDEAGSVSAVLVDYASHPTVLGHDNVLWSADWPGAARRALADALARLVPFPGQAAGEVG